MTDWQKAASIHLAVGALTDVAVGGAGCVTGPWNLAGTQLL